MIIKKMCKKFFHTFLSGNTDKLYYGRCNTIYLNIDDKEKDG
jgi:hypothetical protein